MTQSDFSTLNLNTNLLSNLSSLGYKTMTPIQALSLPHILAGKDVIGQGKTGSGKTAAFGLGLLNKLDVKKFRVQTLVLCPTRELADQVANEIRRLARSIHNIKILTLCGGTAFGPQVGSLEHGAHIIVGTPGRIEEHVRKGNLKLDDNTTLVLDEADRMLEMGFQPALDVIFDHLPKQRQTLLFSATFPIQIEDMTARLMQNPVTAKVDTTHDSDSITEHFFMVEQSYRTRAVRLLLMQHQPESCIIFCNTKQETQDLSDELQEHGFSALCLHGDLEQRDRDQTLIRFANKSTSILVATDVAARGLDIDALDAVINYQIAHDLEVHVHRIGRTGRAGQSGIACTLVSDKEKYKFDALANYLDRKLATEELPHKSVLEQLVYRADYITIQIGGGKKQKIRPGDILGALTGDNGIAGADVGKISINDFSAYVAVSRSAIKAALNKLNNDKIKGRSFRIRSL